MSDIGFLSSIRTRGGEISVGQTITFKWDGEHRGVVHEILSSGDGGDFLMLVKSEDGFAGGGFLDGVKSTLVSGSRIIFK